MRRIVILIWTEGMALFLSPFHGVIPVHKNGASQVRQGREGEHT